jgi:cytoskeletal protein CcmA (bactofilin family)
MAFWKDNTAPRPTPTPAPEAREPAQFTARSKPETAASPRAASSKPEAVPSPAAATAARGDTGRTREESLIAVDITFEGRIEGGGSVRIAGKFKGDVNLQGDLTIDTGAKLTGGVRAAKVVIAGELEGNVEQASRVDLLPSGVLIGDLKTGSLTVAAGARMRGQVEFGWDDDTGSNAGKRSNGGERGAGS